MERRDFLATSVFTALVAAGAPLLAQQPTPPPGPRPNRSLKVGFVLSSEQFANHDLVEFGARADQAGFDAVWNSDHFQPWQANEGHSSLAWLTLGCVGQRSQHLLMGTGVTCPTFRYRPAIVAQAFASLGTLYPGRVFLGVGTGEALNEVPATGERFPRYAERHDRLIEAIAIMRRLWSGKPVTFHGTWYHVENARLYDVPQTPVPMYIAANGPKSARMAGRYGDGWVTTLKALKDPKMHDAFRAGAARPARIPTRWPSSPEEWFVNGDTQDAARGAELALHRQGVEEVRFQPQPGGHQPAGGPRSPLEQVYKDWTVSRNPKVHAEALRKCKAAGATHVFVHSPQPDQTAFIDFFGRQVLPLLS